MSASSKLSAVCQSPRHSPPNLQAVFFWMPLKTASTNLITSVEGNFLTSQQKKSLSMRMWLLMNMDMQTPHGIAQGWGLAAIVLCWSNLKLSNSPQSIFLFGKCFTLYGATLWKWGSLHLPFIIIISDTCMMVWMHKSDRDCYSYNFVFYFGIW